MSGVVSSSGVIVSAKKPNSAYATIAPHRPAQHRIPARADAKNTVEHILERREHDSEAHEVDRVDHRDLARRTGARQHPPDPMSSG